MYTKIGGHFENYALPCCLITLKTFIKVFNRLFMNTGNQENEWSTEDVPVPYGENGQADIVQYRPDRRYGSREGIRNCWLVR